MSHHLLKTDVMLQLNRAWIEPTQVRPVFERVSLITALLPFLEQRQRDLVASRSPLARDFSELDALLDQIKEVDDVHDRKARGSSYTLRAFAQLADDPAVREELDELRELIFPTGLSITQKTYREEAGNAEAVAEKLTDAVRARLSALPTPQGSLLDQIEAWLQAGRQLGALEDQRALLAQRLNAAAPPISETKARRAWINMARLVETILENLSADGNVAPEDVRAILTPVHTAIQQATSRR